MSQQLCRASWASARTKQSATSCDGNKRQPHPTQPFPLIQGLGWHVPHHSLLGRARTDKTGCEAHASSRRGQKDKLTPPAAAPKGRARFYPGSHTPAHPTLSGPWQTAVTFTSFPPSAGSSLKPFFQWHARGRGLACGQLAPDTGQCLLH